MQQVFLFDFYYLHKLSWCQVRRAPDLRTTSPPRGEGKTHPLKKLALWLSFKYLKLYKYLKMKSKPIWVVYFRTWIQNYSSNAILL